MRYWKGRRFPRKTKHTNTNTQIRGEVLLLGFPLTLSTQWVLAPNTSVQDNTEMIICIGVSEESQNALPKGVHIKQKIKM